MSVLCDCCSLLGTSHKEEPWELLAALGDSPASVRLERSGKGQGGGLCKNPMTKDSTLEGRAKKSPMLMEGLLGRMETRCKERSGQVRGRNDRVRGAD